MKITATTLLLCALVSVGAAQQPSADESGVEFAKSGVPNGTDLATWPTFDPTRSDLMMFTPDDGPVINPDPWKERLDLVKRAAEAQHAQTLPQNAAANLGGTSWQLVKFQSSDDKTLTPDDKTKYTIVFGTDGRVSARIDCNRGRGTWKSSGPNQLQFGPLALTRVMCPPGSLHDRIAKDWEFVRSYIIKDGHLFLSLMADGGIYEFEPLGGSQTAPPKTPAAAPSGGIDQYRRYYLSQSGNQSKNGAIKVTYLGTTMLLFDDGETQLLIDGFITRPSVQQATTSMIQTDKAVVDAALSRAKVNRPKALFVAHSHFDHALDVAYIVQQTGAKLYGLVSTLNIGRGGGLTDDQMALYEPGKELTFGQFTVTILSSKHSPPMPGINDDLGIVIDQPLKQPAKFSAYTEGGSFDMLIRHGDHSMLVKLAANYVEGALDDVRADVLFLATGTLGNQNPAFQNAFYDQTVAKVGPKLVIPIHWDNFFLSLSEHLEAGNDTSAAFDFLIGRLAADGL
jgi:L-ascorbate metabolism protein UlaG (beta-lactamase superfamily)